MYDNVLTNRGGYDKYRYSLSVLRFIALMMIIICHIMQYEKFVLAWWFNVGVQIFLCISGFLYGQKNIGNIPTFYHKRFTRILVPYYTVFLTAAILELVFYRSSFNFLKFGAGLFCRTTIAGGEHLWFVPLILFCYTITPVIEAYRDKYIKNHRNLYIGTILIIFILSIFGGLYARIFNPAWLCCYAIGYLLGVNDKGKFIRIEKPMVFFSVLAVIGNGVQIYIDYVKQISFDGYMEIAYQYFCNYNHTFLGVCLFLLMLRIFDNLYIENHPSIISFLKITDNYSYETYLVHQFLIIGPFSLMTLTRWLPINIMIIFVVIIVLTWILKHVENKILNYI